MWLSCWSSASFAWIRKVKTCYFKPMSGSNNNALMFTICSLFAVKINHKVHKYKKFAGKSGDSFVVLLLETNRSRRVHAHHAASETCQGIYF